MNRVKVKCFLLFAFLFFIIQFPLLLIAQQGNKGLYKYPVLPGSQAWQEFRSTGEMIDACQIPEEVLKDISTRDLLIVCIDYPLLNNYTASNSPYEGIVRIVEIFNGLSVFMNRSDSHNVLLEYYREKDVSDIRATKNKGGFTFEFCAIELLLCHEEIIKKFSINEKKEVLNIIMSKYNDKGDYAEYFGFFGKMTTAFAANKYLEQVTGSQTISNPEYDLFSRRMLMADLTIVDEILLNIDLYTTNSDL